MLMLMLMFYVIEREQARIGSSVCRMSIESAYIIESVDSISRDDPDMPHI